MLGVCSQGIDIWAHGVALRVILIGYLAGTPSYSAATERIWQIAAGVMLAITGVAFVEMITHMFSAAT